MAAPNAVNQLSLVPLGAGDLIDRAVRLYRRHFITLVRIAAPPVIVSTLGALMVAFAGRSTRLQGSTVLLLLFGLLIQVAGMLLNVIVMGGAARNLITHLLWNEPVSARTTYRNVRARFGGLFGASIIIAIWGFIAALIAVLAWTLMIQPIMVGFVGAAGRSWQASTVVVIWMLASAFLAFLLFFLMIKFVVYVPQVLMIEGRGVFDSIGRSFALARGNLRRLMAMFLFYWFATWSALMILMIPLGWYGYTQGIDVNPFSAQNTWPMWYAIGYSVVSQVSGILLVPVIILGLSIMYVDERVRQEGYDIELLAARHLMMPNVHAQPQAAYPQAAVRPPSTYSPSVAQHDPRGSTLGLR